MKGKIPIIIVDSLTNDFASTELRFLSVPVHIGLDQAGRVLGEGDNYGQGPLPQYLLAAVKKGVHCIMLRDLHDPTDPNQMSELARFGPHNIIGTDGAKFIKPLEPIIANTDVIDTPTLTLPTRSFHQTFLKWTGKNFMGLSEEERDAYLFVICGFHTNIRILNTAAKIRNDYEFPHVIVSPDLVGGRDSLAHMRTLQVDLPNALVQVSTNLSRVWELTGIPLPKQALYLNTETQFSPEGYAQSLKREELDVLKLIFMAYQSVNLRQLGGGFSGSKLLLADGVLRGGGKGTPVIVKIDKEASLNKEASGYNLVKEYLGNHVANIELLVSSDGTSGARIGIASMKGSPVVLQALFEKASNEGEFTDFTGRLESALSILSKQLHSNRSKKGKVHIYRELGLHRDVQIGFLRQNIGDITGTKDGQYSIAGKTYDINTTIAQFQKITSHVDRVDADTTIVHGDLNLANVISDDLKNIWFIDWTHAGNKLLELDYAKLESDTKYVLSKKLTRDQLPQLRILEEYLAQTINLPKISDLPSELADVIGADFQIRKIYQTVKIIRTHYLQTRTHTNDLLYRATLLRYSVHTLYFNKKLGKGECNQEQLEYALLGTHVLMEEISKDPMHNFAYSGKADGYPDRTIVPENLRSWDQDYPEYSPVSHDEGNPGENPPEPITKNPHGRTGMIGKGQLYHWGENQTVDPVILRKNEYTGGHDVLLVRRKNSRFWELPGAFQHENETLTGSRERGIREKAGIVGLNPDTFNPLPKRIIADDRNTDNAWIVTNGSYTLLSFVEAGKLKFTPGNGIDDIAWIPVDSEIMNSLYANHSEVIFSAFDQIV